MSEKPEIITRQILFEGMILNLAIGIHAFEKKAKQRLRLDLEIAIEASFSESDDFDDVFDYDAIYEFICGFENKDQIETQEFVGDKIAQFLLIDKRVTEITVTTSKLDVFPKAEGVAVKTHYRRKS